MNVQLIDREPVRIAYRRHIGPYGAPIHAFWMQEVAPCFEHSRAMRAASPGPAASRAIS